MPLQTGIFSELIAEERKKNTEILRFAPNNRSGAERRTSLENPQTPLSFPAEWLLDIFNGGRTDSGIRVSEMTALQVSDIFACVDLISSAIASQPLQIFERLEVGDKIKRHANRLATDHPLFDLLENEPNDEMTTFTLVKTLMCHMLLWGNGYAEIQRDVAGRVVALWPRNPAATRPRRSIKTGVMFYVTYDGIEQGFRPDGEEKVPDLERAVLMADMIHMPGLSLDGRIGRDVIQDARQLVGSYLAAEKYAAKFFGNGAIPGGVLTHPAKLKQATAEMLRRSWAEAQGGENQHRVAVLEEGMQYQKIGATPSEAQMIDARKTLRSEVAALFHVPVTMLGETGASRANAEQVALEFVNYTLAPWVKSWEHELKRKLFPAAKVGRNAARNFFAKIDTRALTMPDAASKQSFYSSGRQWGFLSTNDIHHFENLNPVDGDWGNQYWMPVNMVVAGETGGNASDGTAPTLGASKTGADIDRLGKSSDSKDVSARAQALFIRQFRDAMRRTLVRKDANAWRVVEKCFTPVVFALAEFICMHRDPGYIPGSDLPDAIGSAAGQLVDGLAERRTGWKEDDAGTQSERELTWCIEALQDTIESRQKKGVLYIARHGETKDDQDGLSSGKRDTPLDEQGKKDAAKLADYVATKLPVLTGIFAPDVTRHQQTARAVSRTAKLPTSIDDALGPWDIGALSGTPSDGKIEQYKESPDQAPDGGESMNASIQRTNASIKHHAKQAAKLGPRLLIMSHRSVKGYEDKVAGSDVTARLKTGGLVRVDGDSFTELI